MYEQGLELMYLGLRISKPDLTKEEAENIIVNIGNYIQLKRLEAKGVSKKDTKGSRILTLIFGDK